MLSKYFDEYSLNARVRPSFLVLLPLAIAIYTAYPALYNFVAGLISLLLLFGFINALAHFTRFKGKTIEPILYEKWGGKPTTYLLRYNNDMIDNVTKKRYYKFFESHILGWTTPTNELEINHPLEADQYYESAGKWLLEKTRDKKKFTLVFKENMSYGFRRNCFGIKWYGVFLSIISILFITMILKEPSLFGIQINFIFLVFSIILSIVLCIWWLFLVNSKWVKDAAESYAIRLLASCDKIKS